MSLLTKRFPAWDNLSDFFDDDWLKARMTRPEWTPAVNVIEHDNNYEIEVAAPGLKKENFNVEVENGVLTVTGEAKAEDEKKKKHYTRKEFMMRSFSHSFTLPEDVMHDDVDAKYEDGILRLMLKRSERKLPPKKKVLIH
ncbi:MAG: Hsp20/alpha crystallin family protein [Cyclobacteriaceae bacterium]|nr:Hsp20/alpha crystallin family protein [Cyclobacteriaceae bacterium]